MLPKLEKDTFNDCLNLEGLMFKEILTEWRRNIAPPVWSEKKQKFIPNTRSPIYRPLCTFARKWVRGKLRTNYDLHYVSPSKTDSGSADVAFYVTKYMLKPSSKEQRLQQALKLNLDEIEYESIWSKIRPRNFGSLGLGVNGELTPFGVEPDMQIVKYIRECVELSKQSEKTPKFYNPETGSSFPLSRYYRSKFYCYNLNDHAFFNKVQGNKDNVILDDKDFDQKLISESKFKKMIRLVDSHEQDEDLEDIFE